MRDSERLSDSDRDQVRQVMRTPKEETARQRGTERQGEPCRYILPSGGQCPHLWVSFQWLLTFSQGYSTFSYHSFPSPADNQRYPTCPRPLFPCTIPHLTPAHPLPPGSPPCFHSPSPYPSCIYLTVLLIVDLSPPLECQLLEGRDWVCLAHPASLYPAQCLTLCSILIG